MIDLLSRSFSSPEHSIEMPPSATGTGSAGDLEKFFADVDEVKESLDELNRLNGSLRSAHEKGRMLYDGTAVRDLRENMGADVAAALQTAKLVKVQLEALERSTSLNRTVPGSEPGSSLDRVRISVVHGLRKTLKDSRDSFRRLREKISGEYRETVKRRYFTVTGENPDDEILDRLISTGSEKFMQKAIEEQERGRILETLHEIQERREAVRDIEKNLEELHQVFLDMAVLVEHQGQLLDDIESHVKRADSLVRSGNENLEKARFFQKNTGKRTCYVFSLFLLILSLVALFVIRPWDNGGGGGGGGNGGP